MLGVRHISRNVWLEQNEQESHTDRTLDLRAFYLCVEQDAGGAIKRGRHAYFGGCWTVEELVMIDHERHLM